MIEMVSTHWALVWLKNRNKRNIRMIPDVGTLSVIFTEKDCIDGIAIRLSEFRNNSELLRIYQKLNKKITNTKSIGIGPMMQRGISYALSPNR